MYEILLLSLASGLEVQLKIHGWLKISAGYLTLSRRSLLLLHQPQWVNSTGTPNQVDPLFQCRLDGGFVVWSWHVLPLKLKLFCESENQVCYTSILLLLLLPID